MNRTEREITRGEKQFSWNNISAPPQSSRPGVVKVPSAGVLLNSTVNLPRENRHLATRRGVTQVAYIEGVDCSELNLQRLERTRDYDNPREITFTFDTRNRKDFYYFRNWLKRQKATRDAKTYGEALHSIQGTFATISSRYRNWDF